MPLYFQMTPVPLADRGIIGSGGITAEPITEMWSMGPSSFEAELMATFLVKYAKTYDEYCGGNIRVFLLDSEGNLTRLAKEYVKLAEDYFAYFQESMMSLVLPSDPSIDEELLRDRVESFGYELGRRRKELHQAYPIAHSVVPWKIA